MPRYTHATRVAVLFFIFGVLWIFTSDSILLYLIENHELLSYLQTIKGWMFVLVSSVLIYVLINRELRIVYETQIQMQSTAGQLHDSQKLSDSLLDSLNLHIAVIDYKGTIIHVNKAWKQFAVDNGLLTSTIGANYFQVCNKTNDDMARNAVNGMYEVISGKIESFTMEYDCHSPNEKRWFSMTVSPICNLEMSLFMVTHDDITKQVEFENQLRRSQKNF